MRRFKRGTPTADPVDGPIQRTGTLDDLVTSIRIYTRKLLRQWWGSIGLLFGLLGLALKLTGWAEPPTAFWVTAALLTVVVASFQLFHSDRLRATEGAAAAAGPALPYWDGIGLRGNRGGETYLEVMACSQDVRRPRMSTTDFPELRRELIRALGLEEGGTSTRSFSNFFEVTQPNAQGGFTRLAKVDISNSQLFIKLSWRLQDMPVDLAEILMLGVDGLRALRSGACARVLGQRPWLLISLADWPSGGIAIDDLVTAQSWAESDHRGQAVNVQARLAQGDSDWAFVLQFAEKVLGDAGYVGYEPSLRPLSEAAVRARRAALSDAREPLKK
jgi:hypothetical protein